MLKAELERAFGADRARPDARLAPLTTFGVGGPADWLVETRSAEELLRAVEIAAARGLPFTLLGGGSNVLVGDRGVRGVVVRPRGGAVEEHGLGLVRADAAVTINGLVRWTIARGLAGLEAWAGTPGTVGGAIFGNAHYAGRSIGELVECVELAGRDAVVRELPRASMEFAYDRSRLQWSGEILLRASFRVSAHHDPAALRAVARQSLAHRKRTQPLDAASAGCIFQNPRPDDPVPPGLPRSAGALVDAAGLKGHRIGGAEISSIHANFVVNRGGATARDIRALIDLCKRTVLDRFGVVLREEIVFLGEF
jgi:UDP-N-acetylmuramate dehydrogenase